MRYDEAKIDEAVLEQVHYLYRRGARSSAWFRRQTLLFVGVAWMIKRSSATQPLFVV
jgi:hypothetical protein